MYPLRQRKCVEEYHRNMSDKNSEQQLLLVQHFVREYRESEGLGKSTKYCRWDYWTVWHNCYRVGYWTFHCCKREMALLASQVLKLNRKPAHESENADFNLRADFNLILVRINCRAQQLLFKHVSLGNKQGLFTCICNISHSVLESPNYRVQY